MAELNLTSFIKEATRTESRIDKVLVNRNFLESSLQLFLCAGNVLDQIKKNVFYNKPVNSIELNDNIFRIATESTYLYETIGKQYAFGANSTKELIKVDTRILHAILGFATESAELVEQLLSVVQTEVEFDKVNLREELGDEFWYAAVMMDALGADPTEILQMVVNKLRARYPDKFTSEAAINRDLIKERQILEGKSSILP